MKSNMKSKNIILLSLFVLCLAGIMLQTNEGVINEKTTQTLVNNEKIQPITKTSAQYDLSFIHVDNNWSATEAEDWCYKIGNTYYIENVSIDSGDTYGIRIENSIEYFVIKNCTIRNPDYGIFLNNANNGTLMNNNITNNLQESIALWASDNCTIFNNTIFDGAYGIRLQNSAECDIIQNQIKESSSHAINTDDGSDFCEIINNTITTSLRGIRMDGENGLILNNTINTSEREGIFLYSSLNTVVSGNTMMKSGISVSGSYIGQTIYQNNTANGKSIYCYIGNTYLRNSDFTDSGTPGQIILLGCFHSILEGFSFDNVTHGILLVGGQNNTIRDFEIEDPNLEAILLSGSTYNHIRENKIKDLKNGAGIRISGPNNNVSMNVIEGNSPTQRGIIVESGMSYNNVTYNNISTCEDGIYMNNADYNRVCGNNVSDNEEYGIHLYNNADNNIIAENIASNTRAGYVPENGIYLEEWSTNYPEYNNITGNICNGNNDDGIRLDYANYNRIINNTVNDNGDEGIYLYWTSSNNLVNNNTANNNGYYGIYLYSMCNNNNITSNTAMDNEECGILVLSSCSDTRIINNVIKETALGYEQNTGIFLRRDNVDTIVEDNLVFNHTEYGIRIDDNTNRTVVKSNQILNNTLIGAYIAYYASSYCEENVFTLNNFSGNGLHAKDDIDAYMNYWYDPNINVGNYWDNYTEVGSEADDSDDDLIGDIPYPIAGSAGRSDLYPLYEDGDDISPEVIINEALEWDNIEILPGNAVKINVSIVEEGSGVDIVRAMINATSPFSIPMTLTDGEWICLWNNLTEYDPGHYNISIWAQDLNENVNNSEFVIIVLTDTLAPIVIIESPSNQCSIENTESIMVTASIEDYGTSVIMAKAMINATNPFNITMTYSGGKWICTWNNASKYALGDYRIIIWAIDPNGYINQTESIVITLIRPEEEKDDEEKDEDDDEVAIPGFNYPIIGTITVLSAICVAVYLKRNKMKN